VQNPCPEWLHALPGCVPAFTLVARSVCRKPEHEVMVCTPVYPPMLHCHEDASCSLLQVPYANVNGRWEFDWEAMEAAVSPRTKMFLLCNPHNPLGRVWSREDILRLADFCERHDMLLCSDEIHCDMALWGKQHIPFASVSDKAAECSITFGAPSKTFNIAGIVASYAIVPSEELRNKFFGWMSGNELNQPDIFAPIATIAAFEQGEQWRKEMLHYVEENICFVEEFCRENIPQIVPIRPEASFLVWLDCRALGLSQEALVELFVSKAHLALNDGAMFGVQGEGFMRLNVGTPRETLHQALRQLQEALDS
jgi:cystathionine beta-lyase